MALACRADDVSRTKASGHSEVNLQNSAAGLVTCYVTQPDNHVFHVEVDHKAEGQEVLDKICRMLGIIDESEYFGIQYAGLKGDLIWLNMRNRISRQLPGTPPYHLFIKVKYFVPPHTLLLEGTRHQFYLNVAQQLTRGLWDADMSVELHARLVALMTYVQFGSFNPSTTPCKYACFWSDRREEISAEFIRLAASYHKELNEMPTQQAEYELLRIAHLEVPAYGLYYYEVKDMFDRRLLIGVGPEFVAVCATDTSFIEKYPYCRLQTVTVTNRVVTLNLLEDDGSVKSRPFQLTCIRAANSLYRSITEVHCFFLCDNVREDVLQQTNRDLRETLTSFFDHNSKDYAFDVRLTCREVYDRARRRLYNTSTGVFALTPGTDASPGEASTIDPLSSSNGALSIGVSGGAARPRKHSETVISHPGSAASIEEFHEAVQEQLREALVCRVCMDSPINCVFFPCGHTICCKDCADRVDQCPICRKSIELRHPCFLPWDSESEIVGYEPSTSPLSSRFHNTHKHHLSRVPHNSQRGSSLGHSYSTDTGDMALSDAHSLPNLAPALSSTSSFGSTLLRANPASNTAVDPQICVSTVPVASSSTTEKLPKSERHLSLDMTADRAGQSDLVPSSSTSIISTANGPSQYVVSMGASNQRPQRSVAFVLHETQRSDSPPTNNLHSTRSATGRIGTSPEANDTNSAGGNYFKFFLHRRRTNVSSGSGTSTAGEPSPSSRVLTPTTSARTSIETQQSEGSTSAVSAPSMPWTPAKTAV
uniref:E3 ubiquitin-protein ligase MYLIP n=1 Tax=Schistocephalus solidus TaxID=70667 RepID=A0A0X3NUC5_SCHSO